MSKKQTYKEFKKWVDDQVNMAEAMGLDENAEVLPDMVEQNAQAWVQLQEMLEEHTLHYRVRGKKRKKARKNYTISRKKYLDLLKQLYELYDLAEKVEDFQPLIPKEADKNILRLVVRKSPTGESTHYFFHSQDDKVEVSC
ncbi:TPA: hypothetical protein ACGOSD_001364 [Streptococcus suis]